MPKIRHFVCELQGRGKEKAFRTEKWRGRRVDVTAGPAVWGYGEYAGGLEFGVVGGAGEWDDVADVGHTGYEEHEAFESESEAGVRHGTESAGIEIPPHVLHRNAELVDACAEFIVVGFTFGTTDDFTDFREENVHGADGFAILILLHIECLDFLGIVGEDNGAFEVVFHEVTFMFALEVGSPVNGEFEFVARFFKELDAFGVCEANEFLFHHMTETVNEFGVVHLGEEFKIVHAVGECIVDAVFDEVLGEVHVVGDVIECHFGLDHPELRKVAGSVGVFGAESRAEGVYGT